MCDLKPPTQQQLSSTARKQMHCSFAQGAAYKCQTAQLDSPLAWPVGSKIKTSAAHISMAACSA